MSHLQTGRPHLWHGNLMKLMLSLGLLCLLATSEIKAETSNSITTEFAMSGPTEAASNTSAQEERVCKKTHTREYYTECVPCRTIIEDDVCFPRGYIDKYALPEYCLRSRYCRILCTELYSTDHCCPGFWGDGCTQECPGGRRNPCNGHGQCSGENGLCACELGFKGTACELCTDVTKYGPSCSLDCKCQGGQCNNGVHGDGLCAGDNPCQSPVSPCGNNSECIQTGAGKHRCDCHDGYAGDGTECAPINPCQNNSGGCHVTTDCIYTGPNQHKCQCKEGYEGDNPDKGCTIKDMCSPGICGLNAVCETIEPLKHSCVCNEGYTWGGKLCEGNIIKKLEELNTQDPMFKDHLQYMVNIITRFYSELLTGPGPFTLFVPADEAFRNVIHGAHLATLMKDDNRLQHIFRQHIAAGYFMTNSSGSFYNLEGNLASLETKTLTYGNINYYVLNYDSSTDTDKSHVLESNIEAWNGIIHVVHDLVGMADVMIEVTQETAMGLIRTDTDYSTMYSMVMAVGLSELFSRPNTTVLITNNKAWDSMSLLEKHYLINETEGRIKLEVILKNHVFPGVIDVTDLITKPHIKSYANFDVKVHLSNQGQIQLNNDGNITKANIPVKTGLCHRVDQVLVPSYLLPLVNNVCSVEETQKVEGSCLPGSMHGIFSCPLSTDTPTNEEIDCHGFQFHRARRSFSPHHPWETSNHPSKGYPDYWQLSGTDSKIQYSQLHCKVICLRKIQRKTCCQGFYGDSCLPCPGGSRNPCNGHGKCSDGDTGTGMCSCDKNFVGTACERCANNTTFGPHCNEPCTCQFGQCDSGPEGTGKCRAGTCKLPYEGPNCDTEMAPCEDDDHCPVNAKCYLDKNFFESCHCPPGYEEDGNKCSMIDFCAEGRNPCHQQATCSQEGPGATTCTCNTGWHGDGFSCMPNQRCRSHIDCHPSAVCQDLEPGQYRCVCKNGYSGNGQMCKLVNLCVELNGNCHPEAQCTFIKEGERSCTCPESMIGDGMTCRQRTIAEEIMKNPELKLLNHIIMEHIANDSNILNVVNASYTLFAPDHHALVRTFRHNKKNHEYWSRKENALSFLKLHIINNSFSTDDLMAMNGAVQSYPTLYDGYSLHTMIMNQNLVLYTSHSLLTHIMKSNISAVNGFIHIVDKVLVPFIPPSQEPSFITLLSSKHKYEHFFEALQATNVLETLSSLKEYTLFVFSNDVAQNMKRKITGDFLKYHILPKRISSREMLDHMDTRTILGSRYRLLVKRIPNKIFINGVEIIHPDMRTDVGIIHEVSDILRPVNSRCDLNVSETNLGPCGDCTADNLTCHDGFTSLGAGHVLRGWCNIQKVDHETSGCLQICARNTSKTECCGGFYGPQCGGCPGSPEDPCSGNGVCDDGMSGSGKCTCNPGFSGELCESCERADLVPPHCSISNNSCDYMNGNCSKHAWCNETSSGVVCHCFMGYDGDGYTCTPHCQNVEHGKCHHHGNCREHNKCHHHGNCREHNKCHHHGNCREHGKCHHHGKCREHDKCHHHANCTEQDRCHPSVNGTVAVVKASAWTASHATTTGVTVTVVFVLMAIIGVVLYKKRRHLYILRHPLLYPDNPVSYSDMKSQEAEDAVSIPDTTQYENPLFH